MGVPTIAFGLEDVLADTSTAVSALLSCKRERHIEPSQLTSEDLNYGEKVKREGNFHINLAVKLNALKTVVNFRREGYKVVVVISEQCSYEKMNWLTRNFGFESTDVVFYKDINSIDLNVACLVDSNIGELSKFNGVKCYIAPPYLQEKKLFDYTCKDTIGVEKLYRINI